MEDAIDASSSHFFLTIRPLSKPWVRGEDPQRKAKKLNTTEQKKAGNSLCEVVL
jgi:hypothetical protein